MWGQQTNGEKASGRTWLSPCGESRQSPPTTCLPAHLFHKICHKSWAQGKTLVTGIPIRETTHGWWWHAIFTITLTVEIQNCCPSMCRKILHPFTTTTDFFQRMCRQTILLCTPKKMSQQACHSSILSISLWEILTKNNLYLHGTMHWAPEIHSPWMELQQKSFLFCSHRQDRFNRASKQESLQLSWSRNQSPTFISLTRDAQKTWASIFWEWDLIIMKRRDRGKWCRSWRGTTGL